MLMLNLQVSSMLTVSELMSHVGSVCSEPPKSEEPEKWEEQHLSTSELYIQTHNKNPVEGVSRTFFYTFFIKTILFTFSMCEFIADQWLLDDLCWAREPHRGRVHLHGVSGCSVSSHAMENRSKVSMFIYANIVSLRNKKVKDPTLFTENSTKLEASACQLKLPEVSNPCDPPSCQSRSHRMWFSF